MYGWPIFRAAVVWLPCLCVSQWAMSQGVQRSSSEDYLSEELRARVEVLKDDVRTTPANADNGAQRAFVLWDWANAYAGVGGVLPVELPALVARVGGQRQAGAAALRQIDRYVRELTLHDEKPSAIGVLTSQASGPFLPGSYVTIRQTYQFGDMEMVPGGGFFVAKHFMSNQGAYQAKKPKADNYITITSTNPKARFVVDSKQMSGMHGGFRNASPGLFFRLSEGLLTKRDAVTITYGDRRGGSNGFRVQTFSNSAFPLPLYVDLKGTRDLLTLPIQTYAVQGGPVMGVHGFGPSIVKTGESFVLSIRSEDRYRNRASGPIPEYTVTVNDQPYATIQASDQAITLLPENHFDAPGVYRFHIRSTDGAIEGDCNPIWVQDDPELRVYWGDTHGHCGFAEGQGTPESFFEFGRDDARLDFLTHSEHDIWMDDTEWQSLINNVDRYNNDGEFVAILGYEWTADTRRGGHHNVFFRDTHNRKRVPNQTTPVLSQLYRRLANQNDMRDVLIIPHAHMAGEYRMNDPHMETLVEIMSMHGNFEWFGRMYLQHGHEVGFVAASDDHLSHPGYASPLPGGLSQPGGLAAVLAPEKTRDAIFDALKDLAAYATTQQRIILDVKTNGARMGTRTSYAATRRITGRVIATAPIADVCLLKNGDVIATKDLITSQDPYPRDKRSLEVSFYSESDPHVRDNPRGWRPWRGRLSVRNGTVRHASSPSMTNPLSESVAIDDAVAGQVNFRLRTRGSHKNILLDLDGCTDQTEIMIDLSAAKEQPTSPPLFRRNVDMPPQTIRFPLRDVLQKPVTHKKSIRGFEESVTVRHVVDHPVMDYVIDFTDAESPKHGDYYFVRVRQIDGGVAWSSPVWIGGFSKRHDHVHVHEK